jgi:uncharacterized protein with NAD-binding domain and iron-sulfur cluster
MSQPLQKTRVAILGGGIAGLTAAYELISQPQGPDKYEVTVYQMGWRLGGKGASGRNPDVGERIEEHGLHVWSGFYENAFALMRDCYPRLGRVAGRDPLATVFPVPGQPDISPAFRQHNLVVIQEFIAGAWLDWVQATPSDGQLPGAGIEMSLWDYFKSAVGWLVELVEELFAPGRFAAPPDDLAMPAWVEALVRDLQAEAGVVTGSRAYVMPSGTTATSAPDPSAGPILGNPIGRSFVHLAQKIVESLGPDPANHPAASHHAIEWLISSFLKWLEVRLEGLFLGNNLVRRLFILIDLIGVTVCGVIRDGVLLHGTPIIDRYDFREWLSLNGAHEVTAYSGLVRGYYDYCFAYEGGDPYKPSMAAGAGLLHLARLTLQDTGAVFWKMQAGMGDTVFSPLYLVLRDLGVKFAFFHEVKGLHLSDDKHSVDRIDLEIQATVTEAARQQVHTVQGRNYSGEYWPLIDVKDLPCWPSVPLYDQLKEGAVLEERRIDLECPWADWDGVGTTTLVRGQDFDLAVLAMSLAPLKYLTPELMEASDRWRQMVEGVKTTQTVGVQLWCKSTWQQLGWTFDSPLITAYAQPIQTWGDFSQVLPREAWPADNPPGSISYLCGNLPDPEQIPDFSDHAFPGLQQERVKAMAWQWLTDNAGLIWPKASAPFNPNGLDWDALYDPKNGGNAARFDAQFFRANIAPSERYVLCVPRAQSVRMTQGKTPFANLYVAGDYVFTGILGSIEASVMTGMMASRAISGYPQKIYGEISPE